MARRKRITKGVWDRYKAIVNDFVEVDAGKQPLIWLKRFDQILSYGEDTGNNYEPYFLDGLIQYNFIRTWPSLKETVSGELDGINIVLYVTKRSLEENGHLTKEGYWNFDWVQDKFVINGRSIHQLVILRLLRHMMKLCSFCSTEERNSRRN